MKALHTARVPLAALLPLVLLVACGDVDPPAEGSAPPSSPASPTVTATVEASPAAASDSGRAIVALAAIHYVQGRDLHALAATVEEASEVDPRWSGVASSITVVVQAVPWPEEIAPTAAALVDELGNFAVAAEAQDLEAALAAAEAIHEWEHDLAEAAYEWIGSVSPPDTADSAAGILSVLTAIDVIDQSGFHDLARDVAEATETNPRWQRTAERALIALGLASWPKDAAAEVDALEPALREFVDAVSAGDLAMAATASEGLHDAQHDLSEVAHGWLAANHRGMSHEERSLAFACLLRAVDAAGRMGFHDMAAELAGATEVNPRIASRLDNLLVVLDFEADEGMTAALVDQVTELRDALIGGDLEAARDAAEALHDVQHDFSDAAFEHMGMMAGGG